MLKRILAGVVSAALFLTAVLVFRSWMSFKPAEGSDLTTVSGTIKDLEQIGVLKKSAFAEFHLHEHPVRFRITEEDYDSGFNAEQFFANNKPGSEIEVQVLKSELEHPWHPLGVQDGIVTVAAVRDAATTYLSLDDHNARSAKSQIGKLLVIGTCLAFGVVLLSGAIKGMREY